MAEDYERTNARQWDEGLQDVSNSRAIPTAQQNPPQPRMPPPSSQQLSQPRPQQALGTNQRDRQHQQHLSQPTGRWQGVPDDVVRRRRVRVPVDDSDHGRAMAKVAAQTAQLRADAEKRWQDEVKVEGYRKFPTSMKAFGSIGTFHWPSDEYRPEEALGANLEALDSVRMRYDCVITSLRGSSTIQVLGSINGVRKALISLRQTCFQIGSRNIPTVRKYTSHWRTQGPCLYVHLDTEYSNPELGSSKSPRADGDMIDESDVEASKIRETCGIGAVKATLADALRKIHYLRGHIQFRIRLGTFVLVWHKYLDKDDVWDLSEYEDMTAMPQFRGRVTEELGDSSMESHALARLQAADNLLLPHDAMQSDLSEVKAGYSAVFVFKDEGGNLQLTMSWSRHEDLEGDGYHLVESQEKWTRLDRDTGKPADLVEMIFPDLHTGSAWNFDIKTSQAVPPERVPDELRKFSKRVKISTKQTDGLPSITCSHKRSPISIRVSAVYRYSIKDTDYTLELSHSQVKEIATREFLHSDPTSKLNEPRWSLNVYRTEWDNLFALNERLKVSEKANWNDEFEEWFPEESSWEKDGSEDGFKQLLGKLGEIEKVVRGCA